MWAFDTMRYSTEITKEEYAVLFKLFDIYRRYDAREAAFLCQIDYEQMFFYWNKYFTVERGIMGCWSLMHPKSIFIMPPPQSTVPDRPSKVKHIPMNIQHLIEVFPTIVHEIIHAWQFKVAPIPFMVNRTLSYFLGSLAYKIKWSLEGDAEIHGSSEEHSTFFGNLSGALCSFNYSVNMDNPSVAIDMKKNDPEMYRYVTELYQVIEDNFQ